MNRNRVTLPLILLIAAVGLTACQPAPTESLAEPIATLSPTLTPSPIALPTATPTATPTASPTPTFTPTPTPITLPVTNGTPIPDLPYEVITVENVQRLRQIARYGYPRLLQGQPYRLTADGRIIAVGTTLGPEFYDAQTQAKIGGFEVEFLRDYDLSADGRYVLTLAGEDALTVWTQDGKEVRAFDLPIGDAWALKAVALSPDGTLLAVQRKKADWQEADKVDVYRVADGRLVDTVRGEGAVFSPDGQYLATLFDGLRLYPVAELGQGWEKRLPKQSLPWCGATEGNCGLVFSPDGTLAALVRAARVEVYRVAERRLIRQVSGWESDNYTLPQVQFGMDGGRMLITTPALYDGQGNVRVKAQTIVVDVASGEWLSRGEAPEGLAYLDGGQVRTFRWQAEGEMPGFYRPDIKVENTKLIVKESTGEEIVLCTNQECVRSPARNKFFDQNGHSYTLVCGDKTTKCQVLDDSTQEVIGSFWIPMDAYVWLGIIPTRFGTLVVTEIVQGRSSWSVVYRSDGRKVDIANNFLEKILSDGEKIAFGIFDEGLKILDVEQWVVKRYSSDSDLLYFSEGKAYIANQSWDENGPSIQVLDVLTRKSYFVPVPKWRFATTWQISGEEIAESADKFANLFLVSTGGIVYAVDVDKMELVGNLSLNAPYSNAIMKFSKNGRFLMTYGTDGFIRVWGVVPDGTNVK
jgi:WD40 repeat protein